MKDKYLEEVRDYYEKYAGTIKDFFGDTYQAYLMQDIFGLSDQTATNLFLASRAGIKPGDRVLDAGCGAGGPCVDIAKNIDNLTIDAITISSVQAGLAEKLVKKNGIESHMRIHVGDFHDLPFDEATFDVVYFFESDAYSDNPKKLHAEVFRVLKPGGILYIKGVFKEERTLSEQEKIELNKKCRMFAWNITTLNEAERVISEAGFADTETCRLDFLSARSFAESRIKASITVINGVQALTPFGERHSGFFKLGVWYPGEIRARKP